MGRVISINCGAVQLLDKCRMRCVFAAVLSLLLAGAVDAHPGGLNAEGCHTNKSTGEYHCHKSTKPDAGKPVPQSQPPSQGGPKCYTGPRGGTYTITPSGKKNYSGC